MFRRFVLALALIASPAFAQSTASLRGTIDAVSPDGVITAHSRSGEAATLRLKPGARITAVIAATEANLTPGAYIGVAAVPDADGALKALEVHVFAEAMRGVGEGFRPFDLAPQSTMTNGALTVRVESADGPKLTVSYAGGSQTIQMDASTKIVAVTPGDVAELKPGAAILARGAKSADGAIEAQMIVVGRNGVVPPM
jgi:hypothetical protein